MCKTRVLEEYLSGTTYGVLQNSAGLAELSVLSCLSSCHSVLLPFTSRIVEEETMLLPSFNTQPFTSLQLGSHVITHCSFSKVVNYLMVIYLTVSFQASSCLSLCNSQSF